MKLSMSMVAATIFAVAACENAVVAPRVSSSPKAPPTATAITSPVDSAPPAKTASASLPPSDAGAETADEFDEEVGLLQRAFDALRSDNDPNRALNLCEESARRFPNGLLAQERDVVLIEALVDLGEMDEARARAKKFEADFPDSTILDRVRHLVARAGNDRR